MKPYGVERKDKIKSKCPCCRYDKYFGGLKGRKKKARQKNKKECLVFIKAHEEAKATMKEHMLEEKEKFERND